MTNPNINTKRKFLYLHNPKTGGTTIKVVLGLIGPPVDANHQIANKYNPEIWEKYKTIASIRHPVDKLLSNYFYHVPDGNSIYDGGCRPSLKRMSDLRFKSYFREFAKKSGHNLPQYLYTTHKKSDVPLDYLIRYENFVNDLKKVAESLKVEYDSIPWENKSPTKIRKVHFPEQLCEDIIEYYRKDFELFGYTIDYDKICERYIDVHI